MLNIPIQLLFYDP